MVKAKAVAKAFAKGGAYAFAYAVTWAFAFAIAERIADALDRRRHPDAWSETADRPRPESGPLGMPRPPQSLDERDRLESTGVDYPRPRVRRDNQGKRLPT